MYWKSVAGSVILDTRTASLDVAGPILGTALNKDQFQCVLSQGLLQGGQSTLAA